VPFYAKIGSSAQFMVIIMVGFPHHQEVEGQQILSGIVHHKIDVAIFMSKPVDDNSVYGSHQEMNGKQ
jgi:hypothetical protein